jgi:hypothetical protein
MESRGVSGSGEPEGPRGLAEVPVPSGQGRPTRHRGREQVHVNPAEAAARKVMLGDEVQDLGVRHKGGWPWIPPSVSHSTSAASGRRPWSAQIEV